MSEELKAALARIACLEGEIAKRDEELAACRVAVENCEVFRVRIAELESQFDGESIVCGSYRDERDAALAELSAIKAQGVVMSAREVITNTIGFEFLPGELQTVNSDDLVALVHAARLNAAPAQQVSVPVACSCGREYPANSYSAGFISGSGMCEECDAAMPPKDIPQLVSVPDNEDWGVFFGYLIDKCEGHIVAEENLQGWLSEMLADPHYGALFRREKAPAEQPSPIARSIEAAEEEHGSLRAAAKALGIDPGYLYRLKSGEKINPSADVLKALGLERITYYRSMLAAAPSAPAADAGMVAVEWAKDAEEWGPALNEAGWLFLSELNEDPQKSALIFNNTKGPLRAAIMKYAEIVAAHSAQEAV